MDIFDELGNLDFDIFDFFDFETIFPEDKEETGEPIIVEQGDRLCITTTLTK